MGTPPIHCCTSTIPYGDNQMISCTTQGDIEIRDHNAVVVNSFTIDINHPPYLTKIHQVVDDIFLIGSMGGDVYLVNVHEKKIIDSISLKQQQLDRTSSRVSSFASVTTKNSGIYFIGVGNHLVKLTHTLEEGFKVIADINLSTGEKSWISDICVHTSTSKETKLLTLCGDTLLLVEQPSNKKLKKSAPSIITEIYRAAIPNCYLGTFCTLGDTLYFDSSTKGLFSLDKEFKVTEIVPPKRRVSSSIMNSTNGCIITVSKDSIKYYQPDGEIKKIPFAKIIGQAPTDVIPLEDRFVVVFYHKKGHSSKSRFTAILNEDN